MGSGLVRYMTRGKISLDEGLVSKGSARIGHPFPQRKTALDRVLNVFLFLYLLYPSKGSRNLYQINMSRASPAPPRFPQLNKVGSVVPSPLATLPRKCKLVHKEPVAHPRPGACSLMSLAGSRGDSHSRATRFPSATDLPRLFHTFF